MLTYWYQLSLISEFQPRTLLEVGVGTGLVTAYLRHIGIAVTTLDINPRLKPDHIGSILVLPEPLMFEAFDMVLCSRVLHHIGFEDFELALSNLAGLTRRHCLITLPIDDFRLYLMSRVTSSDIYTRSIPLPLSLKRFLMKRKGNGAGSGIWQVNSSRATTQDKVVEAISRYFRIVNLFRIPEDQSHLALVLRNKVDKE
ncbi:class I SAM-dependent methyltransferase [Halomonas kalidii]|uniref:Methyltransferase domain-containing protein n=1 Tax=Halomonas kalidii TaxID=3043293 RepID=A0ABT6VN41_9GAMM|nr:methyltransferase domain-containing protein [Halomonas kalidii]MDI5934383.1 methyltransferase domain-containing protein [Halomonas kalidii]